MHDRTNLVISWLGTAFTFCAAKISALLPPLAAAVTIGYTLFCWHRKWKSKSDKD